MTTGPLEAAEDGLAVTAGCGLAVGIPILPAVRGAAVRAPGMPRIAAHKPLILGAEPVSLRPCPKSA